MFKVENITKRYNEHTVPLHGLSAEIQKGDIISLIGPSGTGKSTFLRCLNMLDPPTEGRILFEGEDITDPDYDLTRLRKRVGMVFQSFNLFNHLTVIENIAKPQMKLLGRNRQEAFDKGMALLGKVGLRDKPLFYPAQLSGGQKQRVAIARAMAMDPEMLLMDEPTSALDPTMVGEVEMTIRDLATTGVTMMIVTHNMDFAREISNRVFYMDQGIIYEDGTPDEIFENPKKPRTIEFIKKQQKLEFTIRGKEFDFPGMMTGVSELILRTKAYGLPWRHGELVMEELLNEILVPAIDQPDILLSVECDRDHLWICADYNGERLDLARKLRENDPGDAFPYTAMALIRAFHDQADYTYEPAGPRANRLRLRIV